MSHFTTAVSLSGVAETSSRTLQSFQDFRKYPLHVFSCMCAWVRVRGFHMLVPTIWMQLIIASPVVASPDGNNRLFPVVPGQDSPCIIERDDLIQSLFVCLYVNS